MGAADRSSTRFQFSVCEGDVLWVAEKRVVDGGRKKRDNAVVRGGMSMLPGCLGIFLETVMDLN